MKKLLLSAFLFMNLFAAQATELTPEQQAAGFARLAGKRLELNEVQIIEVRKLKLATLLAEQANNPAVNKIELEEAFNQQVTALLTPRQKALLNNQSALSEFISAGK